jgi:putative copper export protein
VIGADVVAETVRLAGVVLLAAASWQAVLGLTPAPPLRLAALGVAALTAGGIALVMLTVAPTAERLAEPLGALTLEYVESTRHGRLVLAPLLPGIYALLLLEALRNAGGPLFRQIVHWMLGSSAFAAAWLISVGGHGGMQEGENLEMLAQVLHVAAGLAWVGLLVALVPGALHRAPQASRLRQAGNAAFGLVVVLVACGLVLAWSHGVRVPGVAGEPYGRLLLAKSALLLLALGAAAWNRWRELHRESAREHIVRRLVLSEAAVLAAVVLLAAWVARTPPPA